MLKKSNDRSGKPGEGSRNKSAFSLLAPCSLLFAMVVPAVIAMLLSPAITRAGEIPPGRWWHVPYFADQLNIDDQQKDELDKLFDYNRNRLSDLKKQMEEERNDLLTTIDQEHLNETSAITKMKKLESTRTLLAATRFSYSLEVRKLLGYERFQRLKTLNRNWHGLPQ
jgi:Spy/CpxP family protein refolding chaperone